MAENPFSSPQDTDRPTPAARSTWLWFGPFAFAEIAAIVGFAMWHFKLADSDRPVIYLTLGSIALLVVAVSIVWAFFVRQPEE